MTTWTVLATCGPAALLGLWMLHRISRSKADIVNLARDVYTPPPITDQRVADEWAVITWNYYREEQQ